MSDEKRYFASMPECRSAEDGSRRIVGYGALFNIETRVGDYFREVLKPGAFTSAISGPDADVRGLFNHQAMSVPLGRTKSGTMKLWEDEVGLRYEIAPNMEDPQARALLAAIERGDVSGSSIGFTVKGERMERSANDPLPLRVITEIKWLRDVGPVNFPQYPETTAEARSAAEACRVPESAPLVDASGVLAQLDLDALE